jgi:hypothetical protein
MKQPRFKKGDRVIAYWSYCGNMRAKATYETATHRFRGIISCVPDFCLPAVYHMYAVDLDESPEVEKILEREFPHFYENQMIYDGILEQIAAIE